MTWAAGFSATADVWLNISMASSHSHRFSAILGPPGAPAMVVGAGSASSSPESS